MNYDVMMKAEGNKEMKRQEAQAAEAGRNEVAGSLAAQEYARERHLLAVAAIEILQQLGYLNNEELEALAEFAPVQRIYNWRKLEIGQSRTIFKLEKENGRNKNKSS